MFVKACLPYIPVKNPVKEVLWVVIEIYIVLALGWLSRYFEFFTLEHVFVLNKFVFYFGIPSLVFSAIAMMDLGSFDWKFIAAFLLLRVVCKQSAHTRAQFR